MAINVSSAFKTAMQKRTNFTARASVLFADSTTLTLTKSDFTITNNFFSDSAGAATLPLGEAICRTIQIEIMNDHDQYSIYDFFGATITLYLDFVLDNGTTESITVGKFTVLTPATRGETIIISASDDMWKADKPYVSALTYPNTLQGVFAEAAAACSLPYLSATFTNYNAPVPASLADGETTYRQVFGYIAMVAGGNARISRSGYLEILTYDFADDDHDADHELADWQQLIVDMNDITITGLHTIRETDSGLQDVTVGTSGYVLDLENPIFAGQESAILTLIGNILIGSTFRKFDGNYIADPLIEFMDTVKITDRKQNDYYSVVTDMDFTFGSFTVLMNSAEGYVRINSSYASPAKQALIESRKLVAQEQSARELAVQQLSQALQNASGMYQTQEVQPDLSVIYYLHDKPTLAESAAVIKVTSDAIAFSTNGGSTYPYGIMINGQVIASILSAEGINADWINTGVIRSLDGTAYLDITNGTFSLGGGKITYNGTSLNIAADAVNIGAVNVANQINAINQGLAEQSNFIKFDTSEPSISLIGGVDSYVKITDNAVELVGADGTKATLQSSVFSVAQAEFTNVQMGNWLWISRTVNGVADQNLALTWVGANG